MYINDCYYSYVIFSGLNYMTIMVWKKVFYLTVLKTDTGDLAKYAKVTKRTIFKELGKMTS